MTHFTCLVTGADPEEQLAPFNEDLPVEPYRVYEEGPPEAYWAVEGLREHLPPDQPVTWEWVFRAVRAKYGSATDLALDEEGRAYTLSTYPHEVHDDAGRCVGGPRWDWYSLGGRWTGFFAVKPGHEHEVRTGLPGVMTDRSKPGRCDAGPKGALDLDRMRAKAAEKAGAAYDRYHALVADLPEALPWRHYADTAASDTELDPTQREAAWKRARQGYHGQPRIAVLAGTDFDTFGGDDPVEEFAVPRALYVERARAAVVPGYAMVHQGVWIAPGNMGWFGMSDDDKSSRAGYHEYVNGLIDALPDDTWLWAYDLHT